jgi:hypothetical protein
MKISIVLFGLIISIVCVSCKTSEVQKTSEPKTHLETIEAVNMNPIQLKTGKIACPEEEELKLLGGNIAKCTNNGIFYNPNQNETVERKDLGRPLVCKSGVIKITGKFTGVCEKAN